MYRVSLSRSERVFSTRCGGFLICLCFFFPFPALQALGFVRSLSLSSRVLGLRASSMASTTWSAPLCTCSSSTRMALQVSSSFSVLGFVVHLAPPCLHLAFGSVEADGLPGSVRLDGLSALASPPLCCFLSCLLPRELLQGFVGAGKLVSPFLWFTAVLYTLLVSPEGVFIVTNCMLVLAGTSARVLLVKTVGFCFFGPELSHLGSLARAMFCLYTQDPVAHILSRCAFVPSRSLALSPRFVVSRDLSKNRWCSHNSLLI